MYETFDHTADLGLRIRAADLLRIQSAAKRLTWEDMQLLMAEMGIEVPEKVASVGSSEKRSADGRGQSYESPEDTSTGARAGPRGRYLAGLWKETLAKSRFHVCDSPTGHLPGTHGPYPGRRDVPARLYCDRDRTLDHDSHDSHATPERSRRSSTWRWSSTASCSASS